MTKLDDTHRMVIGSVEHRAFELGRKHAMESSEHMAVVRELAAYKRAVRDASIYGLSALTIGARVSAILDAT